MVNFTNAQIIEFLKSIGFSEDEAKNFGGDFDLFEFLGYAPPAGDGDSRALSPYEILRIPPQIEAGKEKPIVFAIKNKTTKIGKYQGEGLVFFYKSKPQREKSIIEDLKENYRRAMFFGETARADEILKTLSEISAEEALSLKTTYFDYLKHYKKMKKQLLMDVFSHFFLIYLTKQIKSVKKGVSKFDKIYRPYVVDDSLNLETDENSFQADFFGSEPDDFVQNIQSIQTHFDDELDANFDFQEKNGTLKIDNSNLKPSATKIKQNIDDFEKKEDQTQISVDKIQTESSEQIFKKTQEPEEERPKTFGGLFKSFLKKNVHLVPKHLDVSEQSDDEILQDDGKINTSEENSFFEQIKQNIDEKISLEKN